MTPSHPNQNTPAIFWSKLDHNGPIPECGKELGHCWLWTGCVNDNGYGCFRFNGRLKIAHRLAWQFTNGGITSGLCVCHRCDNRRCCNPKHLFLGTRIDNNRDRDSKGRLKILRGEKNGKSKLTADSVKEIRKLSGNGLTQSAIAKRFGVTYQAIGYVLSRRVWRHVQ